MRRAQDRVRSATIKSGALGALKLASEARNENVPAKRADFFICYPERFFFSLKKTIVLYLVKKFETLMVNFKSRGNYFRYNLQARHYRNIFLFFILTLLVLKIFRILKKSAYVLKVFKVPFYTFFY